MHDWTLLSVSLDWKAGIARFDLQSIRGSEAITAFGLANINIPRMFPWGPSVSVKSYDGPKMLASGKKHLAIVMQSGDEIEIIATDFEIPTQ